MSPYTTMYKDLLVMFEKANAKCTDRNLKIEFDFGAGNEFDFSIEEFSQYTEEMQKVLKMTDPEHMIFLWSIVPDNLLGCNEFASCEQPLDLIDESAKIWLEEYKSDNWMRTAISCPIFEDPLATEKLQIIWMCWERYIRQCRNQYTNYEELRKCLDSGRFKYENNYLSHSFVKKVYLLKADLEKLLPKERKKVLRLLDEHWGKLIEDAGIKPYSEYEKVLREVLELPIWKKRYELYAAWISTRILEAFPDPAVGFCVVDGKLSYSFGGAKIAEITIAGNVIYLWAELRSRFDLSALNRTSRKNHIQPDYRLISSEKNPEQSTVEVIECKQYKVANRKNFSEALTDYANACPEAVVILADYGSLPKNLIDDLDEGVRGRCVAYGDLIPGSSAADTFAYKLYEDVLKHLGYWIVQAPLSLELSWEESPKDLDLLLDIESKEQKVKIGYQNTYDDRFEITYDEDIKNGYGPEYIDIANLYPATYIVKVNNFSREVYGGDAAIVLRDSVGREFCKKLPLSSCEDYWWEVLKIDGRLGAFCWL